MRPSNHEAFSRKNILLASTKPPWTDTPDNFEHVADHLTSPAMNIRPVILKKKYCYLREFTAESSLIFTINPSNLHCSNRLIFWDKTVKFFGENGQVFISKKQNDSALKSIPFVLKSYGKMSLLDNKYEPPWLESRYATIYSRSLFWEKYFTCKH